MVESRCHQKMNLDHVCHVIKDVFDPSAGVIVYGTPHGLIDKLREPTFGVEAWGLYHSTGEVASDFSHQWKAGVDPAYFGYDFCELFLSIGYNPSVPSIRTFPLALQVAQLLKKGGKVCLVNPGAWGKHIPAMLKARTDLIAEMRSYSMFKNENVMVFQK